MSTTTTTPGTTRTPRGWAPSPAAERAVLWANLVGQVVLVVTGGAVRLTGSGLGCSSWPQCEPGQFTPVLHEATSWNPVIEFANRTLSGVLVVLALATAWVVWRRVDRAPSLRRLGLAPLAGVLLQAVVGGLTVIFRLHPAFVGVHLLISMALVATSTVLVVRFAESDGPPTPVVEPRTRRVALALLPLVALVLALGVVVTGSGPHSGDEERASRLAFDPVVVSRIHSGSVWLYLGVLVAVIVLLRRDRLAAVAPGGRPRRAAVVLLAVALGQGAIGYVQYVTGLPAVLVGAHMLGAALLVIAQVRQTLSLRGRSALPQH